MKYKYSRKQIIKDFHLENTVIDEALSATKPSTASSKEKWCECSIPMCCPWNNKHPTPPVVPVIEKIIVNDWNRKDMEKQNLFYKLQMLDKINELVTQVNYLSSQIK